MKQVVDGLHIGDFQAASEPELLRDSGVTAVVNLCFDRPSQGYPDGVAAHSFSIMDGPRHDTETLADAIEKTLELVESGETVLVHCSAGESRSGAVVSAAVAELQGVSFVEAENVVREVKPLAMHDSLRETASNWVGDQNKHNESSASN